KLLGPLLDRLLSPTCELAQSSVYLEWTILEASVHIALLRKWPITILGVVARQSEIAERMQPGLLNSLPFRPQRGCPGGAKILVLRQNVLNRVFVHWHRLLAIMIFEATQPVATASKVVEVACLKI